ncbi:MAG: glycoside hydrolase [Lachnospiraceae bacterium]|nr:glycoside hydrolase [Lachnospiraceae bacterium]
MANASKKHRFWVKLTASLLAFTLFLSNGLMSADTVNAAASSSTTASTTRVSVHDPSIFYDSSSGSYYIYGSHMAQAKSSDLRNWSYVGTQGYTNKSVYVSENVEGIYYVQNKFSGLYLDIEDGSSENGANIRQWDYNGSDAQKFKFVSTGGGYYYILTGASGYSKCVDVDSGSSDDGANIMQWEYWGGNMQKYRVVKQPDGTYAILTNASNCKSGLDVYEWSTSAGGNITQWNFWGGDCQKWNLIEATSNSGSTKASTGEPLETALASSFLWAGYNDQDCSGGYAVWAPDIIYNANYVWNDGSKGAYMMYYSTSSTYIRSCIGFAVSKSANGPFSYVDTIVYSGFTNGDNNITTTSSLGSKTVNTNYNNTNIPALISSGKLSSVRSSWFNSNGSYNNSLFPNAIDPTLVYDASGNLWMTYGSWSGGIYILQIDKTTGLPIYPKSNSGQTDGYFGKRIAGGYGLSGEAPYIVYDSSNGYYYLYVTYGWLGVDGGYHIRVYRSKTINGTYNDASGNTAVYSSASIDQSKYGIKLFGNYDLSSFDGDGYKSGGHNSAFIDTDGQRYLVYHTRFNGGTEYHEVRVHQQFLNQDNWPVTAVYEYLGSSISNNGYSTNDMCGTYEFVNHGRDAATANVGMLTTQSVTLNSNGSITGDVTGTWSYTSGTYYCQMTIGSATYKGVFFKQKDESSSHKEVMTFSLIGSNNQSIYGSKTSNATNSSGSSSSSSLAGTYYIKNAHSGLYLDVADGSSDNNANVQQWAYNGYDAQKFRLVDDGNGYYHILTGASGYSKCVDVAGGKADDGTNILQYSYKGSANQQFQLVQQSDGSYAILTRASNCTSGLDVYDWSTESGGNVNQWNFWGGACQKWYLEKAN